MIVGALVNRHGYVKVQKMSQGNENGPSAEIKNKIGRWYLYFYFGFQKNWVGAEKNQKINKKIWPEFNIDLSKGQSLRKLQECLTKQANFRFVLQKISVCLAAVLQHFSITKF